MLRRTQTDKPGEANRRIPVHDHSDFNRGGKLSPHNHETAPSNPCKCPCSPGRPIPGTDPAAYPNILYVGGIATTLTGGTDEGVNFIDQTNDNRIRFLAGTARVQLEDGTIWVGTEVLEFGRVLVTGLSGDARVVAVPSCDQTIEPEG